MRLSEAKERARRLVGILRANHAEEIERELSADAIDRILQTLEHRRPSRPDGPITCRGCARTFTTPQGLGLHFVQRRKNGGVCQTQPSGRGGGP